MNDGTHLETLRDVSRTLLDLLKNNLPDLKAANRIALASPKNAGSNLLTLFLYKVTESPDLKNAERQVVRQPNGQVLERPAPLSLDTYYLLTAHAGDPPDQLEAHRALSRAMRVFYDNGILQGSQLRADDPSTGLTESSVLRITLNPISMEDMTRIWSVFPDVPYEISVSYLVTPVEIDSRREITGAPVVDQIHEQAPREAALESAGA
jgi:Pvc16 N-terminal domain